MDEKQFFKWLDENVPVHHEVVRHSSDEAGASIWIRFDVDKEDDDDYTYNTRTNKKYSNRY